MAEQPMPLPWVVEHDAFAGSEVFDAKGIHVCDVIGEAKADLIVRAVNSHADAMNALEMAHAYFASHSNGDNEASEHFRRIGAVLSKMRGEA